MINISDKVLNFYKSNHQTAYEQENGHGQQGPRGGLLQKTSVFVTEMLRIIHVFHIY